MTTTHKFPPQVIAQSGSNFSPSLHSVTAAEAEKYSRLSGDLYGCLWSDVDRLLSCMQSVSAESLAGLNDAILINLKPNEDGEFNSDPFLPVSPMEALRTGAYNQNVSVMIGSNKDDGIILTSLLVTNPIMYFVYRSFWTLMAPGILFHRPIDETTDEDKANVVALADFYIGGTANMNSDNYANITQMFTDAFATYAVECFVQRAATTQRVYQYLYAYDGEYGLTQGWKFMSSNHSQELCQQASWLLIGCTRVNNQ